MSIQPLCCMLNQFKTIKLKNIKTNKFTKPWHICNINLNLSLCIINSKTLVYKSYYKTSAVYLKIDTTCFRVFDENDVCLKKKKISLKNLTKIIKCVSIFRTEDMISLYALFPRHALWDNLGNKLYETKTKNKLNPKE